MKIELKRSVALFGLTISMISAGVGCSTDRSSRSEDSGSSESAANTTSSDSSPVSGSDAAGAATNSEQQVGMSGSNTSDEAGVSGSSADSSGAPSGSPMGQSAGTTPGAGSSDPQTMGSQISTSAQSLTPVQMSNEMVLNQLHHINQKEIQLAKMAQEKAQSQKVKSTAQQVMEDHQQLESKVQAAAQKANIQLLNFQPATYEVVTMDLLKGLSGAKFDQYYMQMLTMGHLAVEQQLRLVRSEVKDPQIRSLIDSVMPDIKQHRKMSHKVEKQVQKQAAGTMGEDQQ